MLDRIARAVYGSAPERLEQALALRGSAGRDFALARAQQRAADEGVQMVQVLDAFLRLFDALADVSVRPARLASPALHRRSTKHPVLSANEVLLSRESSSPYHEFCSHERAITPAGGP